ncbi:histidine kinase [uncultured Adlercreutzia sp.]|uniref:GAF domain-containing sensor histidine kinase n=1 Tax=uncultured Adlercreutzia sp. TaxID=875803 RepID=UPI0025FCD813|nr:histidine kinase [uncultured Adlercreutzia sp.]
MAKRESGTVSTRGIGVPKFNQEMLAATIAALAAITLVWTFSQPEFPVPVLVAAGAVFTVSIVVVIRLMMDPDSVRALQSDAMLQLASSMIDAMGDGLTEEASQEVCELLLPNTSAIAVALTNRENVLGYAGYQEAHNPAGIAIRTSATHECIATGKTLVLLAPEEIGLPVPSDQSRIKAAIVEPLMVADRVEGTLKFYYRDAGKITETQRSIAHGFAQLLATQMAAVEMETQRKLAASMELKMLQTQINPHFLFNTINTIASFIRTDPAKARTLLREFAVFYRRTLEDSTERISLARELDQVQRYFNFELARFGEARVALEVQASPALQDMLVPPFLVQPLVENAIKHAMPSEGKLTITVSAEADGDDVVMVVADDGVGMSEETCANITQVESSTGLGIAVKNVHDRMIGFFGPDAQMVYTSVLGEGTQVTLRCPGCAKAPAPAVVAMEAADAAPDAAAAEAAKKNQATVAELTELVAQVSE